jgi:DnaK suppressor protein
MKKSELAAIKQALDGEIKSTEKKIIEYSLLCQPIAPENSIGRVSRMDAINNKSVVEAALKRSGRENF